MAQSIIIYMFPVTIYKSTYQQKQCTLGLMKIGDKHLNNLVFVTRRNYYLSAAMKNIHIVAVKIIKNKPDCIIRLQIVFTIVRLPLLHMKAFI